MAKNKGLGKGFADILFTDAEYILNNNQSDKGSVMTVRISDVEPDKNQPRKNFNQEALNSLAQSIERHGVLQPIVVKKIENSSLIDEKYSIISGERRWRASKIAGLSEIPVVVKDISDSEIAAIMLVENLQREDLNPIEQAQGFKRLIDEYGLTQEETSKILSVSRPAITNALRLLTLPEEALDLLSCGDISAGHGRALLSLEKEDDILSALQIVVRKNLSVRETEKLVKQLSVANQKHISSPVTDDNTKIYMDKLEEKISSHLGRKSFIKAPKGKNAIGKLEIEYYGFDDLEALLKKLCGDDIFNDN